MHDAIASPVDRMLTAWIFRKMQETKTKQKLTLSQQKMKVQHTPPHGTPYMHPLLLATRRLKLASMQPCS
jgi:hypothetical protein